MFIESLKASELVPFSRNSRTHSSDQISQIVNSIKEFGFTNPVLIDENGGIIAGHGRVMAAESMGMEELPCIRLSHLTDEQKRAYVIADNKLALNAGWDEEMLRLEIGELKDLGFNLGLTGFSEEEIGGILRLDDGSFEGLTDEDAVPDVRPDPVSEKGDIWNLGFHRVMCGDSLSMTDLTKLMQGAKADMVWTDPPYLMDFTGAIDGDGNTHSKHKPIANDKLGKAEGEKFLRDFTAQLRAWCNGAWYITFYRLGIDWMFDALKASGLRYRNLIIWKKNHLNLSNSDYKSIYEPMILGWADDYVPVFYGWTMEHPWHGTKGETDVWEVNIPSIWEIERTKKNDLHPTMKPVELINRSIQNSTKAGDVVLDFFGGSGSTLIAATKTGRIARLIELEPTYVDVIVRRWQEFTGKEAVLESNGKTFLEIESKRKTSA
jgi:DNA modification methylase